jgi:hypothetical protein
MSLMCMYCTLNSSMTHVSLLAVVAFACRLPQPHSHLWNACSTSTTDGRGGGKVCSHECLAFEEGVVCLYVAVLARRLPQPHSYFSHHNHNTRGGGVIHVGFAAWRGVFVCHGTCLSLGHSISASDRIRSANLWCWRVPGGRVGGVRLLRCGQEKRGDQVNNPIIRRSNSLCSPCSISC